MKAPNLKEITFIKTRQFWRFITLISVMFLLLFADANAQTSVFSIAGIVKDENGTALPSVTVFIDGSDKYTMTDNNGHFLFTSIVPGAYRIATSMVGRASERVAVNIIDKAVIINLMMKPRPIELNEVVIGTDLRRLEMLKIFTNKFLGVTDNAKSCKILNPEIIEFTTNKNILFATTTDFLVIENKNLGYRIKYLLKIFRYDKSINLTSYTGDCIFEELSGTKRQKKQWASNRLEAYEGSFMHFLRSLYAGDANQKGFKSYAFVDGAKIPTIIDSPVDMNQYVTRIDSNFVKLAFRQQFKVTYNSIKAIVVKKGMPMPSEIRKVLADSGIVVRADKKPMTQIERELIMSNFNRGPILSKDAGVVKLYLNYTLVDRNGNYLDYRSFLLQGLWNRLQMGDRLPFTYWP